MAARAERSRARRSSRRRRAQPPAGVGAGAGLRPSRGLLVAALCTVAALLVVVGGGTLFASARDQAPPTRARNGPTAPGQLSATPGEPTSSPEDRAVGDPTETALPARTVRPVQVRIPAIGVRSSLERLGIGPKGELRPPHDPDRVGWFRDGPVPGDLGAAVLAGHVDSVDGPAVFWRLAQLRPGDRVTVVRSDGSASTFAVTEVGRFAQKRFPTGAVYGPTPDRALRMITCGGPYDRARGHYRDNVVVFALAV